MASTLVGVGIVFLIILMIIAIGKTMSKSFVYDKSFKKDAEDHAKMCDDPFCDCAEPDVHTPEIKKELCQAWECHDNGHTIQGCRYLRCDCSVNDPEEIKARQRWEDNGGLQWWGGDPT